MNYTYLHHGLKCMSWARYTTSLSHSRLCLGLSAQHHAVLLCTNDASKPLAFKWFLMHSNHVFCAVLFCVNYAPKPLTFKSFLMHSNHFILGQPLELLPVMIVLSIFLGHVSGSTCWRWPFQCRRSCLSIFSMLLNFLVYLLSSFDAILSVSFIKQIHLIIFISMQLRRETSSCIWKHLETIWKQYLNIIWKLYKIIWKQ